MYNYLATKYASEDCDCEDSQDSAHFSVQQTRGWGAKVSFNCFNY